MSARPLLPRPAVVSFDVYSALVDSRRGGGAAFAQLAARHGWDADPGELWDDWDARNKALHAATQRFVTFRALATRAMASLQAARGLPGEPTADADALLASVASWPPWPDVPDGLAAMARRHRVALLSNVDDDVLARTDLGVPSPPAVTSQQARCYKPHAGLYRFAEQRLGTPLLHVAASARDVRGALEAGLAVVRVARPGHRVDPAGPQPPVEVDDLLELDALLR